MRLIKKEARRVINMTKSDLFHVEQWDFVESPNEWFDFS
jgi:hypothetical protein